MWKWASQKSNWFILICIESFFIFSQIFMFECKLFNDEIIQKTKLSHIWNGSKLTSQTAHLFSSARHFIFINVNQNLIKVWWKLYFSFQSQVELCFCTLIVMLKKLAYFSHGCIEWSGSRLWLQTVHFFCFMENKLPYFLFLFFFFIFFFVLSCVFQFFMFEIKIFSNKNPETKHPHVWNGS